MLCSAFFAWIFLRGTNHLRGSSLHVTTACLSQHKKLCHIRMHIRKSPTETKLRVVCQHNDIFRRVVAQHACRVKSLHLHSMLANGDEATSDELQQRLMADAQAEQPEGGSKQEKWCADIQLYPSCTCAQFTVQ